jgi:hypothetical protein
MRRLLSVSLAAVGLAVLATTTASADTAIVVNFGSHPSAEAAGHSEATVNWLDADTRDDTICTECFAAVELQAYLRKMTGRDQDFPVVDDDAPLVRDVILVGAPASNAASARLAPRLGIDVAQLNQLGPEGYRIKANSVDGHRVTLIAGGGRVGTLYGVYDLLFRHGCRWFAPGPVDEEVPRLERMFDLDVTERPDFAARGFLAWEDRGNPEFFLWMARNRLNEWCIEQSGHPLLHKLGIRLVSGMHDEETLFLDPGTPYPYKHARFPGAEDKPADPYPISPEYQGDANHDGKLSYFEAHPEWYAWEKGRRIPGIRGWFGTNFCTSNPDAVTEFMRNFLRAIVAGPYRGSAIVRFWTLDAGRWCQCPQCLALGIPTDRNLLLVHRLDREIKKARADGRLDRSLVIRFLAYADVLQPPTRPLPADFDYQTCAATFYPIARCYVHDFADPKCKDNQRYVAQLAGWVSDPDRHYRGQVVIGEYYNISGFKCLPIGFQHTMANDIPHYYKAGARDFEYMHVTTGNWGNKALTNYQMARQLWSVRTDCPALWKDYFAGRYGAAAESMAQFYDALEKMLSNVRELKYGLARRLEQGAAELFPNAQLRYERRPGVACDAPTLVEIVDQAKVARKLMAVALKADLPPRIKSRIAEDERMFTYGERTVDYYHACVQGFQAARAGQIADARRHYDDAERLAGLLRADTTSTTQASSHANAPNALVASGAAGAPAKLAQLLKQSDQRK